MDKEHNILHLCVPEKFIPSHIELINENFPASNHTFLIGKRSKNVKIEGINVIKSQRATSKIANLWRLYKADKILLHGLYDSHYIYLLALQPWLLKKCYWLIWGNDLYQYTTPPSGLKNRFKERIRAFIIERFGHLVTYIRGDYKNAQAWYQAKGRYHECLLYESNTFHARSESATNEETLCIQIGNSAYPRNNHIKVLDKLLPFREENIEIYVPLSYGPPDEVDRVSQYGKNLFGDKFIPVTQFMPFDQYKTFLDKIDIGIFNQDHQQAMGNMITLLGMGKSLYIRRNTTPWELFSEKRIKVFNIDHLNLTTLTAQEKDDNIERIKTLFSKQRLIDQYSAIFSG